jgi:hypothetical protein
MLLAIFSNLAYGFRSEKVPSALTSIWALLSIIAVAFGIYNFFYEIVSTYGNLLDKGFGYFISKLGILGR